MYSGNITRIYTSTPDPLECGIPKRVLHEEQHLGEMLASTKKRVTWRFTLGESDRIHEVVLVHSVMSHKKLVQYDGRQVHFSSTKMVGNWCFTMILDGLRMAMEVRISEVESADVPKYDFVVNRIPFRRWDVYRRKKHALATAPYAQPNSSSGNTYGTQHWGPGGATPSESQNESERHSWSPTGSSREIGTCNLPNSYASKSPTPGQLQCVSGLYRNTSGHTSSYSGYKSGPHTLQQTRGASLETKSVAPVRAALKPEKRPEINLIDDFGPSISVSAQSLIFDPLARAKMSSNKDAAAPAACQQQQQHQAPLMSVVPKPATSVDPFASVAPPAVPKPVAIMNTHPCGGPNTGSYQQQLTHQMGISNAKQVLGFQQQQRPMVGTSASMGGTIAMQQHQPGVCGFSTGQHSSLSSSMGNGNYNNDITQLLNPASVATSHQNEPSKSIDIDAFAGIGR
uniref:Uncharacterized protein n=1 Tax=Peronospora matthiolae TaxID=2874970 RepID=A0AAV1T616_9STRA